MPDNTMNQSPLPRSNRTPFEWSLSALQPSAEPANSSAILFEAGRSSRDREVRMLKIVCAGAGLLMSSLLGLFALNRSEAPQVVQQPTSPRLNSDVELPPHTDSMPYAEITASNPDQRIQLSQRVRPWRAIEQPKAHEPSTTDARELAEQLQFRRSLLNTGLGLLPTDVPDLSPAAPLPYEK